MAEKRYKDSGFREQKRVCSVLNEMFVRGRLMYEAREVSEEVDRAEKYDIEVIDCNGGVQMKIDVKSSMSEDSVSYTIENQNRRG